MEQFAHISVQETQQKLTEDSVRVVDIRDDAAFAAGHIKNSIHLTNGSLHSFMADVEFAVASIFLSAGDVPVLDNASYHTGKSNNILANWL